jgi:hypothetical protein
VQSEQNKADAQIRQKRYSSYEAFAERVKKIEFF